MGPEKLAAAIGGGAFVLASLVVGARLLWLARRTRGLPELCMGAGLLWMGGLGYPLISTARLALRWPMELRTGLMIAAHVLMVAGIAALAVFNWRVFRPDGGSGRLAAALTGGAALLGFAWQGLGPGFEAGVHAEGAGLVLINAVAAATMLWCALESLALHRMLVRRLALRLADPAVVDRVRLWSIATAAAGVISGVALGLHALDMDPAASLPGALTIGPLGLVAAGCLWLAFLPPAAYRRRFAAPSTSP